MAVPVDPAWLHCSLAANHSSMLIVLSPAKALDFSAAPEGAGLSAPQLAEATAELAKVTKKLTVRDPRA
jgi:hypothetical protein